MNLLDYLTIKKQEFNSKLTIKKAEFKAKKNKLKDKFRAKKERIISTIKENIPETFFLLALLIIGLNSLSINIHFGWYIIAAECLLMSKIMFNFQK